MVGRIQMERETPSYFVNSSQQTSNFDELLMQQHLLFSESLKDLKNIRKQLYSAAEYFESSYQRDDKQLVVETLKHYVTNALVSSVDHLGSVAFKVNSFLDEKINEFSDTEIRFSSIEQRLSTCQEFTEQSGVRQQTLVIETPKYHKRYIFPVEPTIDGNNKSESIRNEPSSYLQDDLNKSIHPNLVKPDAKVLRKGLSQPPSATSSSGSGNFLFTRVASKKVSEVDKRGVSPLRFLLKRTGSVAERSSSPISANKRPQHSPVPQRSSSLLIRPENSTTSKAIVQYPKKSKNLFKLLLRYTSPRRMRD